LVLFRLAIYGINLIGAIRESVVLCAWVILRLINELEDGFHTYFDFAQYKWHCMTYIC